MLSFYTLCMMVKFIFLFKHYMRKHMPIVKLQSEPLESLISPTGTTIVDFYADWCGPCKMIAKSLHEISEEMQITVVKVNTDDFPELTERSLVTSLPTLFIYKDGVMVEKFAGAIPKAALLKKI